MRCTAAPADRRCLTKLEVVENCRATAMKIVFMPTIAKGVNDHQIGDIVRVAIDHIDTVSGISFQLVAFTGYIPGTSCLPSASRTGVPTFLWHPHFSLGTYFFVDQETKQAVPITQFVDVPGMLQEMEERSRKTTKLSFKLYSSVKVWNTLQRHFHQDKAPGGRTFKKFLQTLQGPTDKKPGRGLRGARAASARDLAPVLHRVRPAPASRSRDPHRQFSIPWDPKMQQAFAVDPANA